MRILTVLTLLLCAVPGLVAAGPWARDRGDVFLSYTFSSTTSRNLLAQTGMIEMDSTHSFYAEVGLGHRLTFGGDLNLSGDNRFTTAFLRRTLTAPDATWQAAVQVGGALQQEDNAEDRELARLGLSLGRGFGPAGDHWAIPIRHQGGWAVLDSTAFIDTESADLIWQVEGTLGLAVSDRLRGMVSVLAEDWTGGDLIVTARPSVLYGVAERTTVRLGGHVAVAGDDTVGVVLGLWQEF